jgi:hypothetical protein
MVRKPKPTAQGPPDDLEHISSIIRRVMQEVTVVASTCKTRIPDKTERSTSEANSK